ncbi:MAG: hypothetical protein KC933_34625, partial [Myxococcales bacterium]|nr:hypothetical protein [Myxococcales bacterium]
MRRAAVFFALLAAGCGRTDQPTSSPYLPIFSVITTRLPDGHVGEDYDARVVALAEPPAVSTTWSVSGALPPGLAILPEGATSARVVGTPTTPGTSTFRLQLVDVDGRTATGDFSVSILGETLRILTSGLPMARAGELYEGLVEADGGVTPYTWRVLGALPEGLSARGSGLDLAITGSPQELGVFDLEVEVTDAVGAVATRALRLEVDGYVPLRIVTANLPQASLRSEYRAEISATGGEGAYTWILAQGRLPAGLTLGGAGTPAVELAGLPTEAGRFSFLVRVSDGRGTSAERRLVLEVGSTVEPLRILTSTFPEARADRAYEAPVVAEGGLPPYQWRLESGQL